MKAAAALALVLILPAIARAAVIDDSDFSKPAASAQSASGLLLEGRAERGVRVFALEALDPPTVSANVAGVVTGRLVLLDRAGAQHAARLTKVRLIGDGASAAWTQVGEDGRFTLSAPTAGSFKIRVSLDGPRAMGRKRSRFPTNPWPAL